MKFAFFALPLLLAVGACSQFSGPLGQLGVGASAQASCMELVRSQINDPDRDSLVDRLKDAGLMCLVAAANDVLTVDAVDAPVPALEGAIVAEDAEAAAAIQGEVAVLQ